MIQPLWPENHIKSAKVVWLAVAVADALVVAAEVAMKGAVVEAVAVTPVVTVAAI